MLDAAVAVKVTGPVTIKAVGHHAWHKTIHASDGHFVATVPAGRYLLTGKDGNAHCAGVKLTVRADRISHVTVTCNGM